MALQHGLSTGRTNSFAVLGDWGIGKSSLLLKFAAVSKELDYQMLPVFISASKDIQDYFRFAESLLDKFAEALATVPKLQVQLRSELQQWKVKWLVLGGIALDREARQFFLSSGSSLLRHTLSDAWSHLVQPANIKGVIFFLDDLQNIAGISKADLALMIRDQFQSLAIEGMNYSVCFSAKGDYFAETKGLAEPAVRFYSKIHLTPFSLEETFEYVQAIFGIAADASRTLGMSLYEKTLGHPYFLAFICRQFSMCRRSSPQQGIDHLWPSIFEQLGREKFRSDLSQVSGKELDFLQRIAKSEQEECNPHQFESKVHREYFNRLTQKGLLIRTGRGRYKLYHPLFRLFLKQ